MLATPPATPPGERLLAFLQPPAESPMVDTFIEDAVAGGWPAEAATPPAEFPGQFLLENSMSPVDDSLFENIDWVALFSADP